MNREECLNQAKACVCQDRESQYGSPEDNFGTIAKLWSTYKGIEFSSVDVATMMILLKVARVKNGNFKEDNFVDIAGYSACACECGEDCK